MGAPPNTPGNPWLVKGILALIGIAAVGAATLTFYGKAIDVQVDGVADSVTTDGLVISNNTASTVGAPLQYSPRLRFRSSLWDTDGSSDTHDWFFSTRGSSGSDTYPSFYLTRSKNGAAEAGVWLFDTSGNFYVYSNITTGSACSAATFYPTSTNLTAATMASYATSQVKRTWHAKSWTNAMVVAGRASATTSNVSIVTLPAGTVVTRMIIITAAATHADTVTVSAGRTGAAYIDFVTAQSAKAAATYGDALTEMGTNLKDSGATTPCEDFAGLSSGTTTLYAQFVCGGGADINTITGCTGTVYLETFELPLLGYE